MISAGMLCGLHPLKTSSQQWVLGLEVERCQLLQDIETNSEEDQEEKKESLDSAFN